jgi:hypothetical protein
MSWISFCDRLEELPLILAGPNLQHTSSESVTVWVALKESCRVTLQVYETANNGKDIARLVLVGEQTTIALGQSLHVVAVTAKFSSSDRLLGWEEKLPLLPSTTDATHLSAKQMKPGQRSEIASHQAGFTAGIRHKAEYAKSHLFSLGEYYAIYLFTWSHWQCRLEWIHRQPLQLPERGKNLSWLKVKKRSHPWHWLLNLVNWLWQNRWFQDGDEVVGVNNLGYVQFIWSDHPDERAVIQDNYWYTSWGRPRIALSRFKVSLNLSSK